MTTNNAGPIMEPDAALVRLAEIRQQRERLDADELVAVAAARAGNRSWARIAEAVGTTGSYMCRRFKPQLMVTVEPAGGAGRRRRVRT